MLLTLGNVKDILWQAANCHIQHVVFFNNSMYSGQPWEAKRSCDTEASRQAGDVLSLKLNRC